MDNAFPLVLMTDPLADLDEEDKDARCDYSESNQGCYPSNWNIELCLTALVF